MKTLAALALLVIVAALPVAAQEAEAELKPLLARLGDPASGSGLREELLAFRRKYPGTSAAVKAAEALARLASPADRLDAGQIPELEKFDWQPKELVAVVQEHRGRHGAQVLSVASTPDGKRLFSGGLSGLVRSWDAATMRLQEVLHFSYGIYSLAFTPDGKTLAAGDAYGNVWFWDVTAPQSRKLGTLKTTGAVTSLYFGPGGKRLALGTAAGHVQVWDGPWDMPPLEPATSYIGPTQATYVAFTPDAKYVVSGTGDGDLKVYDPATVPLKVKQTIAAHVGGIRGLAFDPIARELPRLATAGADGKVAFWRVSGGKLKFLEALTSKSGAISAVTFSADGKYLTYGAGDFTVRVVTAKGHQEVGYLKGHANMVTALTFLKGAKGLHVVSGSSDWTVRRWDDVNTAKAGQKTVTGGHLAAVYAAAFAPDDETLLTGSEDNTIRTWELARPQAAEKVKMLSPARVYAVAWFPDGKRLAAAGNYAEAQVWDLGGKKPAHILKGHAKVVATIDVAPDGKQVLTGGADKSMRLWDASTGLEVRAFAGYTAEVNGVAFSPDGRRAVSASGGYLYDENNRLVNKGGQYQYTDCIVRLWDLPEGQEPLKLTGPSQPLYRVAVAPDGKEVAAGGVDLSVRLWSVADAKEVLALPVKGHTYGLAYSPDGRLLAITGSDQRVLVYDRAAGKMLHDWPLPEATYRVAFAGDSRHLAITLTTGVVYVMRLAPPAR